MLPLIIFYWAINYEIHIDCLQERCIRDSTTVADGKNTMAAVAHCVLNQCNRLDGQEHDKYPQSAAASYVCSNQG